MAETPEEEARHWTNYFLALPRDDQERLAMRVLDAGRRSARCIEQDHDGYLREHQEMLLEHPICLAHRCDCTACTQHLARGRI